MPDAPVNANVIDSGLFRFTIQKVAYATGESYRLAMADQHATGSAKISGQGLGEVNRPMAAASAANGNGQIRAIVAHETRQPFFDVVSDIGQHFPCVGIGLEIGNHWRILAS